jgi:pSer/pThr/pTyr-binding forkhead associated (FHA) protein
VIQLNVLSGKTAGTSWVARRFPVRVGRATISDLRLEEDGVWDQHLVLSLDLTGFLVKVHPDALARVNGEPITQAYLRNGDTIEIGTVRLQFWLRAVPQSRLRVAESLSWGAIFIVGGVQIGILYWLLT